MPTHYIPPQVIAVLRPQLSFEQEYSKNMLSAQPGFVVPSTSEKMLEAARVWAKGVLHKNLSSYAEIHLRNTPMKNLQVVGVENRAEDGTVFKVITDQGYLVDFREPELMEALFTGRIGKDGFIKGEYVWSVGGNQMRLVLVGSDIYNKRLKAGSVSEVNGRKRKKMLSSADLVVGNEYFTTLGRMIYAGRIRRLSDWKLCFAWYEHLPNENPLGQGHGTKRMYVSTNSIAQSDFGKYKNSLDQAALIGIFDGHGNTVIRSGFSALKTKS